MNTLIIILSITVMLVSLKEASDHQGTVANFWKTIKACETFKCLLKAFLKLPLFKFTLFAMCFVGAAYALYYCTIGYGIDALHLCLMSVITMLLIPKIKYHLHLENRQAR